MLNRKRIDPQPPGARETRRTQSPADVGGVARRLQQTIGNSATAAFLRPAPTRTIQRVKATYVASAGHLLLGEGEGARTVQVSEEEAFHGAPARDQTFEWEPPRGYKTLKELGADAVWVYDAAAGTAVTREEFTSSQRWRTYNKDTEEATVQTGVPPSTSKIPLQFFKNVALGDVESIAQTGLAATHARVTFGGFSAGTTYGARDRAIAAAAWLGVNESPGKSMQPHSGKWIMLRIAVPTTFRDAYLRDLRAVMHNDLETNSDTVLAFSPILPQYIFIAQEELASMNLGDLAASPLSAIKGRNWARLLDALRKRRDAKKSGDSDED
jgi:hypothetical protein